MAASKAWSSAGAWLAIAVGLAAVVSSSEAYVFYAGGRDGWVLDPTESYNHWAGRNRFQVNDTIVFTHEEGVSSVLLVTEEDFDTCNTRSPVQRLEAVGGSGSGSSSVFRFDRSGPFFFISSDEDRCQKGQKLYIIVMAPRPPVAMAPALGPSQWTAFPPAGATAPPPLWASAPDLLGAPPPTAGASRSVGDAIVGSVVGVVGALVLCTML
ncbi:early nodulin-like protein 1 [Setaria italica]|uniref:early nodulin-like protein 1 n=1 Tax=Setaria italica TaxID=4555 RepID=UPI0003511DE5|nr:early nodulin-like protein 1 [Setaria italica]